MNRCSSYLLILLLLPILFENYVYCKSPHIILIVADDLGWNDVGFHGSNQIPTPNIDALAYSGVILNNYYVQPICTPSRGALLTGMHPIHTGLQTRTINAAQPYALPLNFSLLPEQLNSLGYVSRMVGKWHLGFYTKEYTPIFRGFKSHRGYWTGRIDYYEHTSMGLPVYWGLDFRYDLELDTNSTGIYATDIFTEEAVKIINNHNSSTPLFLYLAHLAVHVGNEYEPLQAPKYIEKKFSYIKDVNRRKFAAILHILDEGIGKVVEALDKNNMLQDSVIIFTSDNGGAAEGFNANAGSNWPLRGVKATFWEGGVKGAAAVWSPKIKNPGRVSQNMMQIMDWFPTLLSAAGGHMDELPTTDGIDVWQEIVNGGPSSRTEILHNIDPSFNGAAIRIGEWKVITNSSTYEGNWDFWYGPSGRDGKDFSKEAFHDIVNSPAGIALSKFTTLSYDKVSKLRRNAEVICDEFPINVTMSCNSDEKPCLFHIPSDPCEYHDVSQQNPYKVREIMEILRQYNETAVTPLNEKVDSIGNPVHWNYAWTYWKNFNPPPIETTHVDSYNDLYM